VAWLAEAGTPDQGAGTGRAAPAATRRPRRTAPGARGPPGVGPVGDQRLSPAASARRHRFADIRDTQNRFAISRSLASASISSAVANRTRSRRTGPFCGGQPAALLADAVTILFARAQWLADHGKREWEPPPAMPALVIIIDEYAELARVPSRPRTAPARPPRPPPGAGRAAPACSTGAIVGAGTCISRAIPRSESARAHRAAAEGTGVSRWTA
jgi:hypothetical protein